MRGLVQTKMADLSDQGRVVASGSFNLAVIYGSCGLSDSSPSCLLFSSFGSHSGSYARAAGSALVCLFVSIDYVSSIDTGVGTIRLGFTSLVLEGRTWRVGSRDGH
ncbi:hypothetical protein Bca4012_056446 [Brassica carinata]